MSKFVALAISLLSLFSVTRAIPLQPMARSMHSCSVFIQRWYDNSFDIYDYAFAPPPCATCDWNYIITVESVPLQSGQELPPSTMGSNTLAINNVANPSASAPNTDPGSLSFTWGSISWSSNSCTVAPRGDAGALSGQATTYSCNFECNA